MLKLCFNSTTLRNLDLFRSLSIIKTHGYEGVELTLNDSHLHPLKHSSKKCHEIKAYCDDIDLEIVCLAAGGPTLLGQKPYEPSLISTSPIERRQRLELIKHAIEFAHILDTPVLNINSGKQRKDVPLERTHHFLITGLQELLDYSEQLTLVVEPEPDFFIGTTGQALELLETLPSPRLRLNLDIGHVFCSENDCYENIEKALPCTRHIHIEDIKNGVHHHEIPGEGDIDFERIFTLIKQAEYKYAISVELHHHDTCWERALKESRDFLLKKWPCTQLQCSGN